MSSVDTFLDEVDSINREFPGFTIKPKEESGLCKVANAVLLVLTLGTTKFMTDYITVIRKTMYVPSSWKTLPWINRWIVLRHEGVHLRQAKAVGLGWFGLGWILWSFAYLFLLPFGWTLRGRWEREAYSETIRCSQRFGVSVSRSSLFKNFTGPQYFYMDLRRDRVSAWLDSIGVQ